MFEILRKIIYKRVSLIALFIILLFEIYFLGRSYLFATCFIPTYSMSPTLKAGDYVFVTFLVPGRRILVENDSTPTYSVMRRDKGISPIKRNDVIIHNYPYSSDNTKMRLSSKVVYCKRCIAIPGDIFFIDAEGRYRVKGYDGALGNLEAQLRYRTICHFDSIYLPKRGDIIKLDSISYQLYYRCIEYETNAVLCQKGDKITLNGIETHEYRFKQNYYYVAGDNVINSNDSRYWGILPEDFIIGVAKFIWFSKDMNTGNIRWNRFFRRI